MKRFSAITLLTFCMVMFSYLSGMAQYENAVDKNGLRKGKWKLYMTTGSKYVDTPDSSGYYRIINYKNGKPEGKIYDYSYADVKLFEGYLTSADPDTLNGPAIIYYDSGARYQEVSYINNQVNGMVKMYFENGAPRSTCNYTDDLPDGEYNEYYENGQLHRTGHVKSGKKQGQFIFFSNNGDTSEIRNYLDDVQHGMAITYKKNTPDQEIPYKKGKREGVAVYHSGSTLSYGMFYHDRKIEIDSVIYLSSDYISAYDGENALPLALLMEEYFRRVYPDNAEINDFSASTLASIYSMQADTVHAPFWIKKHYEYYTSLIDTKKEPDADHWHLLSVLSETFGLHTEATVSERRAIAMSYDNDKPTLITLQYMQRMADIYLTEGNITEGFKSYDSILHLIDQYDKVLGDAYTDYALAYANNLSDYNYYDEATELLTALKNRSAGTDKYYAVLYQLGKIDIARNKTDNANQIFTTIYNSFGKGTTDTLLLMDVIGELADHYSNTGDYRTAEKLYLQMTDLAERSGSSFVYAGDLADFYDGVGRYNKSLAIREKLLADYEEQLRDKTSLNYLWDSTLMMSLYIDHLVEYARTNEYAGNRSLAGQKYEEATALSLQHFSDTSFNYMHALAALAGWQMDNGDYADAGDNYKKVIGISEIYFKDEDVNYYTWLSDLAELYTRTKNYNDALAIAEKVYNEESKDYAVSSPVYIINTERLAAVYDAMGNAEAAAKYYLAAMDARVDKLQNDFSVMNENEREQYLATFRYTFDEFNYFALKHADSLPELAANVLNYQLANKSALLFSAAASRRSFSDLKSPASQQTYTEWLSLRQLINKYEPLSLSELSLAGIQLDSLQYKAAELEKTLTLQSGEIPSSIKQYKWQQIKAALKKGEAAIEYITIPDYTDTGMNYNQYAAIIVRYDAVQPQFIYLTDEDSLAQHLLKKNNETDAAYVNRIYGAPEDEFEADNFTGQHLYRLVWQPLLADLHNINTVYISASGILNKLNIAALPASPVSYVNDTYSVLTLSSLTALAEGLRTDTLKPGDNIALMGGINYDATDKELTTAKKQTHFTPINHDEELLLADAGDIRGGSWKFLPGSLNEVDAISSLLQKKEYNCAVYENANATEESFKNFGDSNTPRVIHIASHGFFLSDSTNTLLKNKDPQADHAMFNSGILLAGGNRSWKGDVPADGLEDGILTAAEVSDLNLTDCNLVVLSACETGLGEIKNDEGVFGLQRAFRLAGAGHIIMSLWQVSDKETALFMQTFYDNWSSGKTIQEAFISTQNMLRKQYTPYYWAAFVLVE